MKLGYLEYFKKLLCEALSWSDLLKSTRRYTKGGGGEGRIDRAGMVRVNSRPVSMEDGRESWNFSYKSFPSTTGNRWNGFIQFIKGEVDNNDFTKDLECIVNCNCPDYKYVWAYSNMKNGAGFTGPPYNDNNGRPWLNSSLPSPNHPTDRRMNPDKIPGLCKHLIALASFLESDVSNPKNNDAQLPSSDLYERIVNYGKNNPDFYVPYYDMEEDHINENYFRKGKGWMIYEGDSHIVAVFEDNSKHEIEIDFRGNIGEKKNKFRNRAANTWKRLAKEIHDDVEITEVGNRVQKSWNECFREALSVEEMKEFIKGKRKPNVFSDISYSSNNINNSAPCIDPINFTPRA